MSPPKKNWTFHTGVKVFLAWAEKQVEIWNKKDQRKKKKQRRGEKKGKNTIFQTKMLQPKILVCSLP